jgi:glycosyltransferase involved in cell wall biosynthesis
VLFSRPRSNRRAGRLAQLDLPISVVIATRDRPDLLKRVVGQVLDQVTEVDELVVVDDSTSSVDLHDWLDASVVVLRSRGRGPAAARNLGWRRSTGEIIAFTDDDVQLDPGWLAAIRRELAANAALVGIEGRTVTRPFDRVYEYSVQSDYARNGLTCNVAYRRATLERLGGFDENFPFAHCEDVDLFTRAKRLGAVQFAASVIVDHEPRPIIPALFTRRGGWLSSERRLYSKHPELRPYRLPPGLCALVDYVRWPIEVWLAHAASDSHRDVARLRRAAQLAAMWWWHMAKEVPSLALTEP